MKKIETIWHYLLSTALTEKKYKHTQAQLAYDFGYSLSTIHHSLKVPERIGAVRKTSKFFVLSDFKKLLYYSSTIRNLEADILFETYVNLPIREIEGSLPPRSIFACCSAVRKLYTEPPADYSKVYFYLDKSQIEAVKSRFPPVKRKEPNVIMLKKHKSMEKYGCVTSLSQTFADIWNLKDWYARDYIDFLEEKINGLLS